MEVPENTEKEKKFDGQGKREGNRALGETWRNVKNMLHPCFMEYRVSSRIIFFKTVKGRGSVRLMATPCPVIEGYHLMESVIHSISTYVRKQVVI